MGQDSPASAHISQRGSFQKSGALIYRSAYNRIIVYSCPFWGLPHLWTPPNVLRLVHVHRDDAQALLPIPSALQAESDVGVASTRPKTLYSTLCQTNMEPEKEPFKLLSSERASFSGSMLVWVI